MNTTTNDPVVIALHVLVVLRSSCGARSAVELAELTGHSYPEVFVALNRTVALGLVARMPGTPFGHASKYRLTEAGMW